VKTQSTCRSRLRSICSALYSAVAITAPGVLSNILTAGQSVTLAWDLNPEPGLAGYTIYLGISSGIYSTVTNVAATTSAVLPDLTDSTSYYCAIRAVNTSGVTSELSPEISFTTQAAASPEAFDQWITARGLSGAAAEPEATPFHDGVSNLLKYAFNMNPAGSDSRILVKGTGTAGLPAISLEKNGTHGWLSVEFLRRKGSGLIYQPQTTTNLVTYESMTGTTTVTQVNSLWERVVVRKQVDLTTNAALFGRVEVTDPLLPESTQVAPISLFNSWAAAGGLSGSSAVPGSIPFNDGVSNLLKYAFNLNSSRPDTHAMTKGTGDSGLPVFTLNRSGSRTWFEVEFLRRKGSGLAYVPIISSDLVSYSPMTGNAIISSIDESWDRVIIQKTIDPTSTPKLFGTVEVTLP
jgi:hypothetical protein